MTYYNEHDLKAAAWLDMLSTCGEITTGDVDPRDVQKVKADDLRDYDRCHFFAGIGGWDYALRLAGWPADAPVWTASLPCQPFSAAGKQRGTEDERHLWPVFRDLVEECRPPILFGEQVASKPGRAWLASVQTDLEALGYSTAAADLCAAGCGAPHIRQRLYWCAIRMEYSESVRQCSDKLERNSESGESLERAGEGRNPINGCGVDGVGNTGSQRRQQVARGAPCDEAADGGARRDRGEQNGDHLAGCAGEGGRLAHGNSSGLAQHPQEDQHKRTENGQPSQRDNVVRCGSAGGLAHSSSTGLEVGREQSAWKECATVERGGAVGSPWNDVVYIPCADGKARPIKPEFIKMVDGVSGHLAPLRNSRNDEEEIDAEENVSVPREVLRSMWGTAEEETIPEQPGMLGGVSPPEVLRSEVHGIGDGKGSMQEHQPQQDESSKIQGRQVREMRGNGETPSSPHRLGPAQQRFVELEDALRFLPSSLSLAKENGDRRTELALQNLREAICEEGSLQHPPHSLEKVWRSLSEEGQARVAVGFNPDHWMRLPMNPLVVGMPARAALLKGYGNAIVPQVAAVFIRSVMEAVSC